MKILSQESNIGIATTVSSATAVRLYNSDSSAGIVTRTDSSNSTIGNFTIPSGEVLYLQKKSTDKLVAPSTVLASKVAYSHMMSYASYASSGGGESASYVTDNLVFHVDAGNSSSYSGSGTTVNSLVGSMTSNTFDSDITYSSSNGGYWTFNSSSKDGIQFDASSFMPLGSNDVTYESWYKITSYLSTPFSIWRVLDSGSKAYTFYNYHRYNNRVRIGKDSGSSPDINTFYSQSGANTFAQNSWQHIVASHDTSTNTIKTYVNGSLVKTTTHGTHLASYHNNATDTYKLAVGTFGNNTFLVHKGDISIVRFYKGKALSATEVTQNFDAEKSRYGY